MSDYPSYASLSKNGKKLPIQFLVASLMKSVKADNPCHLCEVLDDIKNNKHVFLRNMPKKKDRYWHKKLVSGGMNMPMIKNIEAYVPNITYCLEHKLWKVLDSETPTINQSIINHYKHLYGNNTYPDSLYQLKYLYPIVRKFNIDSFTYLICIARDQVRREQFHILPEITQAVYRLNFALSINQPFRTVGFKVYKLLHKSLYLKERQLLEPFMKQSFVERLRYEGKVTYPLNYQAFDYPKLTNNEFQDLMQEISHIIEISIEQGDLKNTEHNKIKFVYYLLCTNNSSQNISKCISSAIKLMTLDKRGHPYLL